MTISTDNDYYYEFEGASLYASTLFGDKKSILDQELITNQVVIYEFEDGSKTYLPDNYEASITINPKLTEWNNLYEVKEKDWLSGLQQQAQWMQQTLYPQQAKTDWLDLVKSSFKTGIMTPLTSYIVLENEAQEAILLKKQKDILAGNKNLDLEDETFTRMSEPELYLLLTILAIIYLFAKRKKLFELINKRNN